VTGFRGFREFRFLGRPLFSCSKDTVGHKNTKILLCMTSANVYGFW